MLSKGSAHSSRIARNKLDVIRQILSLEPKFRTLAQVRETQELFKDN